MLSLADAGAASTVAWSTGCGRLAGDRCLLTRRRALEALRFRLPAMSARAPARDRTRGNHGTRQACLARAWDRLVRRRRATVAILCRRICASSVARDSARPRTRLRRCGLGKRHGAGRGTGGRDRVRARRAERDQGLRETARIRGLDQRRDTPIEGGAPPVTAKVTGTPATGRPAWSTTRTANGSGSVATLRGRLSVASDGPHGRQRPGSPR